MAQIPGRALWIRKFRAASLAASARGLRRRQRALRETADLALSHGDRLNLRNFWAQKTADSHTVGSLFDNGSFRPRYYGSATLARPETGRVKFRRSTSVRFHPRQTDTILHTATRAQKTRRLLEEMTRQPRQRRRVEPIRLVDDNILEKLDTWKSFK